MVFASAFTLIIKWVQVRKCENVVTVGAINYIVAAVWSVPLCLQSEIAGDITVSVVTGSILGGCYFAAYFFVIYAIQTIGAASTSVISALSILLPVGCGILIWNEQPNACQIIGVVFATAALLLVGGRPSQPPPESDRSGHKPWVAPFVLVAFFVLAGSSRLAQEAFKHEGIPQHFPVFLTTAFVTASIPSVALLVARQRRVSRTEFAMGFAMGAANILQTQFILQALKSYDGFVVFPVSSAGGLMLITLMATGLLGERIDRRKALGIAIAVCALVLLNW